VHRQLGNRIQLAFKRRASIVTAFLDIAGAFDNVIPSILFNDPFNDVISLPVYVNLWKIFYVR